MGSEDQEGVQPVREATKHHTISVQSVPSSCGTPGHRDLQVKCSCGMDETIMHGDRKSAQDTILYHRLSSLEKVVGMKIAIEWLPGS